MTSVEVGQSKGDSCAFIPAKRQRRTYAILFADNTYYERANLCCIRFKNRILYIQGSGTRKTDIASLVVECGSLLVKLNHKFMTNIF